MSTRSEGPVGILLMAYGSPRNADEVGPYLAHIRGGATPSAGAVEALQARYRALGGSTPLLAITEAQAAELQAELDRRCGGGACLVRIGMKHWHPFIADAVAAMAREGVRRIVAVPLAPHFSRISIGSYAEAARSAAEKAGLAVDVIDSWHDEPHLVACVAEQLGEALRGAADPSVVFTAHSLPARIRTWNDPYEAQLKETCRLVAGAAGVATWTLAFQSAVATGEPWLGPSLADAVAGAAAAGRRTVVVCPVGFVSDHLEILYDIDIAAAEAARAAGIGLVRTASRNTHPSFIAALASLAAARAAAIGPRGTSA